MHLERTEPVGFDCVADPNDWFDRGGIHRLNPAQKRGPPPWKLPLRAAGLAPGREPSFAADAPRAESGRTALTTTSSPALSPGPDTSISVPSSRPVRTRRGCGLPLISSHIRAGCAPSP